MSESNEVAAGSADRAAMRSIHNGVGYDRVVTAPNEVPRGPGFALGIP